MKTKQKSPQNATDKGNLHPSRIRGSYKWLILCLLFLMIPVGVWTNFFTYEYYYFRCEAHPPVEVDGEYYRLSTDKEYGIRPGSDYSHCIAPEGVMRDPRAKINTIMAQKFEDTLKKLTSEYDIYLPEGYAISGIKTIHGGDYATTEFLLTTGTNRQYLVREMKKGAIYDYASICNKPQTEHWSGVIIGTDRKGRQVCKTNTSKYVKDYFAGIAPGRTAIVLRTETGPTEELNAEVIDIFSSMELSKEN